VDAGSPRRIAKYLAAESKRRRFRLMRLPYYLPPHRARNMGAVAAVTRYIVFVDNDVIFSPGWLNKLIECAELAQADVVTPLICIGEPVHTTVHVAGGVVTSVDQNGRRRLREVMRFRGQPLAKVSEQLARGPTELVEFHSVLIRKSLLDRMGPFDEAYLASSEHLDFSFAVRQSGGSVFFEPRAVISYIPPPPLALSDTPYYTMRWSDEWTVASEQHFHRKWGLDYDDRVVRFAIEHRRLAFRRVRRVMLAIVGWRRSERFSDWLDASLIAIAKRGTGGAQMEVEEQSSTATGG